MNLVRRVSIDVHNEQVKQLAKWGEQNHPDGTGGESWRHESDSARAACEQAFTAGAGTWRHILDEEFAEACAEGDALKLRAELVQVAAVAMSWIEAIDRRT